MRNNKTISNYPEVFRKPKSVKKGLITYLLKSETLHIGDIKLSITRTERNGAELLVDAPKDIKITKV